MTPEEFNKPKTREEQQRLVGNAIYDYMQDKNILVHKELDCKVIGILLFELDLKYLAFSVLHDPETLIREMLFCEKVVLTHSDEYEILQFTDEEHEFGQTRYGRIENAEKEWDPAVLK